MLALQPCGKRLELHRGDHVYLAGSLVASRKTQHALGTTEVTYLHTDALGTPVAFTDAAGNVTRRERMTAWGEPADGTWSNEPGYTGHQMDAGSKLVYMQQRYYDPTIGRFLSADPLRTNATSAAGFNRFAYGNDNPHRFTDPDGRRSICATQANCDTVQFTSRESGSQRLKRADTHINKVQKKLDAMGNRFSSPDAAARFFRDNFAEEGRYLQIEFGANAEPGTNSIVDIRRSPGVDAKTGVGSQINLPRGLIGGASFHTHPDIRHPKPGFSWGDVVSGRSSGNDYEYVFYGSPVSVGRKWDIQATKGVESAAIYHYQDTYAPIFK